MRRFIRLSEQFRDRLAFHDATPQLVLLGLLVGLASALLIVLFRLAVELPLGAVFDGAVDGFEQLSPAWRLLLPVSGGLLLGGVLRYLDKRDRHFSVTHVLDRLHQHQGKLPARNIAVQFFGGIVALLSGQSVGREGPGIHLGAGIASQIGQWLRLPNNSLRTLVGCGVAAAIAASFNTPMAGVIFAMEVILMEYTIAGFIPIIIAAVTGAVISQLVFGLQINVVDLTLSGSMVPEIPFLVACGLVISVAASLFVFVYLRCLRWQQLPLLLRFFLAGLLTGVVAMAVPQIMGTGYDTLDEAINGELEVQLLAAIVVAKLLVTAIVTGLGMVGGLIGPTLVIGGCLGGLLGVLGNALVSSASDPQVYVLLGMVAMMGAVLNAPLAALVAILELSHSPELIFPGMLIVVVACLGVQLGPGYKGIFAEHLRQHGFDLLAGPGKHFLSRIGVRSVMNRSLRVCEPELDAGAVQQILDSNVLWLVSQHEDSYHLLASANLARHVHQHEPGGEDGQVPETAVEPSSQLAWPISLAEVPAPAMDVQTIDSLATLYEASSRIRDSGAEALLVLESLPYDEPRVVGVLTRETILNYYGM